MINIQFSIPKTQFHVVLSISCISLQKNQSPKAVDSLGITNNPNLHLELMFIVYGIIFILTTRKVKPKQLKASQRL